MASTGFPLPLRNALAALVLDAFDDETARAALVWIARPDGPPPPDAAARLAAVHLLDPGASALLEVHAPWREAAGAHAHRALHALARVRPDAPARDPVERAVVRAAALWAEGLFFEVHEVLEAVWQRTSGALRHALQGVIQIAVAWHHLGHGNRRGARNLLRDGRTRLAEAAEALPSVDAESLLATTAPWLAALRGDGELPAGPPPPLPVRPAG